MNDPISELTLMEAKATLLHSSDKDILAKHVDFFLLCTATLNKILLNFFKGFSDFARDFDVIYGMSRHGTEGRLDKNSPFSRVKELGFPPC